MYAAIPLIRHAARPDLFVSLLALLLAAGCGDSTSSPDSTAGMDMTQAEPPPILGTPIQAPANTWTWIDFPDSVCDEGTPTGLGINPGSGKNLLVFLNGGGACWDYTTCFQLNTSAHGPFQKAQFDGVKGAVTGSILDRTANNPFKDFTLVFIPYCTGDVHSGDNVATYKDKQVHHQGRKNLKAFLSRLAATYPSPDKLVVSGSSAGGFGSALNYDLFRHYFPQKNGESYLLDDSGPAMKDDAIPSFLRAAWYASWGLSASLGQLCPACTDDMSAVVPIVSAKYPKDRLSLLSYTQDQTIRGFFMLTAEAFQADLYDLAKTVLDPLPNLHYFFKTGTNHTFLGHPAGQTSQGVDLQVWLGQMVNEDPKWSSIKP